MLKMKRNKGITVIALVITIVVLLILAGVSISMLTGENGILNQAQEAKEQTKYKSAEEKVKLAIMGARADGGTLTVSKLSTELSHQGGTLKGSAFPVEVQMNEYFFYVDSKGTVTEIPEGLEVGTTIEYVPSGIYSWPAKYCSSTQSTDTELNSAETNFKITKWKVLDIENGKVILVPTAPSTGKVHLGGAQGYNNGVELLNDACNSLYGDSSKGISAESLDIKDIEKYMTEEALSIVHSYDNGSTIYDTQTLKPYTINKNYPIIYAKEKLSTIDSSTNTNGLEINEQIELIEQTENGATEGKITTAPSIRPYQTYWYFSNQETSFKVATNGTKYYDLIIPKNLNSPYWLASRCINVYSDLCGFDIYYLTRDFIDGFNVYNSNNNVSASSLALFPKVSLDPKLIKGDKTNGFIVE